VAACPANAIAGAHFNFDQISAEIAGALWDALSDDGDAGAQREAETLAT